VTRVELIYDRHCPNVAEARAQLLRAFAQLGTSARWTEWDREDPSSPDYVRTYGSPTILVNGRDVADQPPTGSSPCCRVYVGKDGRLRGTPSVDQITAALSSATGQTTTAGSSKRRGGWLAFLAALPGVVLSLLPVGACPACWPAYAGVLGSLGLGFVLTRPYLLPLTGAFLLLATTALAYKARTRRGYGPFLLGLVASVAVLCGKFLWDSEPTVYAGVASLVAASVWNTWPRKRGEGSKGTCPACAPSGQRPEVSE